MSADNWADCPKCKKKFEDEQLQRIKKANEAYGKAPQAEYCKLVTEASIVRVSKYRTFREDYGIGLEGEELVIDYYGRCDTCRFEREFKYRG